jgi:large subunit ribosomal protein L10
LNPGTEFSSQGGGPDRHGSPVESWFEPTKRQAIKTGLKQRSDRPTKEESKVDKAEKAEVVEDLKGVFANAGSLVVAHYTGMTVAQMGDLRARMRAAGASFKVAKNRLAVRALQGTAVEGISHLFKGPTGIAYSKDPVAASKVAVAYAKDNDKLVILGGSVGVTTLDANGVKALATLPSLDELRGKIVGLLVAPATKIAGIVQAPAGQLARVIGAYSKKEAA